MDIALDLQPKVGGVVKLSPHFGYKIGIFTETILKFGRLIQRNPKNYIMTKLFFKNTFFSKIKRILQHSEFGLIL